MSSLTPPDTAEGIRLGVDGLFQPPSSSGARMAASASAPAINQAIPWLTGEPSDEDLACIASDDPDAGFVCLKPLARISVDEREAVPHGE